MVYENTYVTYLKQHFQRRQASTELQCIERLALEIMKWCGFGWEWHMSLPVNSEFTKIDKNVEYALECNERLVFKPFLINMKQNINVRTHLVPVGTGRPQELPVEHTVVTINE